MCLRSPRNAALHCRLPLTDRSTRVRQPRTVRDLAEELHALLAAAHVPAPYVLVGHSLGGLIALFYARTYPSNVRGIVFVDGFSPTLPAKLGDLWPLYREVLNPPPARQPVASLKDAASETVDIDTSVLQVRRAPQLRRMPLIVLTKTEPFRIPPDSLPPGITAPQIDRAYVGAQDDLVNLAPSTPHVFAIGSEHYIQLSQPDLVIEAVQLVIHRILSERTCHPERTGVILSGAPQAPQSKDEQNACHPERSAAGAAVEGRDASHVSR